MILKAQEMKMPAPIVFFDIAGPADAKLKEFYGDVFGWSTDAMGRVGDVGIAGADRKSVV